MQTKTHAKWAAASADGSQRTDARTSATSSERTAPGHRVAVAAGSSPQLALLALALAAVFSAACDGALLGEPGRDVRFDGRDGQVDADAATDSADATLPLSPPVALDGGVPTDPPAPVAPTPAPSEPPAPAAPAPAAPAPAAPAPAAPGWDACPHHGLLHSGLHPEASDRLRCAGVAATRITQTIGTAPASAGYHLADGTASGHAYCAAVDLRSRDLSTAQLRTLLDRLWSNGFVAWYRQPGSDGWPTSGAPHIHAVFAGVVMKSQLRAQVRDFLLGRNGLTSHTRYTFRVAPTPVKTLLALLFSRHY